MDQPALNLSVEGVPDAPDPVYGDSRQDPYLGDAGRGSEEGVEEAELPAQDPPARQQGQGDGQVEHHRYHDVSHGQVLQEDQGGLVQLDGVVDLTGVDHDPIAHHGYHDYSDVEGGEEGEARLGEVVVLAQGGEGRDVGDVIVSHLAVQGRLGALFGLGGGG